MVQKINQKGKTNEKMSKNERKSATRKKQTNERNHKDICISEYVHLLKTPQQLEN